MPIAPSWQNRQQKPPNHWQVIRYQQRVIPPYPRADALQARAVKQIIHGPVRPVDAVVVGEVGQPLAAVGAAGFGVVGDHRVFFPQRVQFAVGCVAVALLFGEALVLTQRQQVEVAADQPGCAAAFQFAQQGFS